MVGVWYSICCFQKKLRLIKKIFTNMKNKILQNSKLRCTRYRKKILKISQTVPALHIGGAFSSVEIVDCIFNLLKKKKDKFILSKGHAGILQYVVLNDLKILSNKDLLNYCKKDGILGVHPDYGNPGIEASTGSLGHGLALAAGIAYASNKNDTYVLLSDGEMHEGSVWEAALTISSINLNNLIIIIDYNGLQSSTWSKDTHPTLNPIDKKFKAFGWEVESCNGHNSYDIFQKINNRTKKKPFALVANTKKGYPISFMENVPKWHYRSPDKKEYTQALSELDK
jgi:transketolase